MPRELPDYENPPAVETALGVRFSPIAGWNVFHYGLLLSRFKEDYPRQEIHPPVGEMSFQITPGQAFQDVPIRCWFVNREDTQLVQIQNNCFIRNWRKTDATPDYLHYDVIRPLFHRDWSVFLGFLHEQQLPEPVIWQSEVTYINHFVRGRDWNDYKDLPSLYRVWKGLPTQGLFGRPEAVGLNASYALPDGGSLQFVSQPAIRRSDGAEIIQLAITAVGKPAGDEIDVLSMLDSGRKAVVLGFAGFLDEGPQLKWGKK